jgi:hypothetical protein
MAENQGFKVDGGKCPAYLKQSKTAVSSYSILPSTGALKTGLVSTSLGWENGGLFIFDFAINGCIEDRPGIDQFGLVIAYSFSATPLASICSEYPVRLILVVPLLY